MTPGAIAVIGGTGKQGLALAQRWAAVGLPVILGSRDAGRAALAAVGVRAAVERARGAGARTGAAPAITVEGRENLAAAQAAEIVVIAVPAAAHADTLTAIAPGARGKIIVDCTVPLDANPAYAVRLPEGSAAEAVQRALGPETRVVGAFHTVPAALLADLARAVDCDVLVCGDDDDAKVRVSALAEAIGARAVDVGALRQAHTLERVRALLIGLGRRVSRHALGVRITGL